MKKIQIILIGIFLATIIQAQPTKNYLIKRAQIKNVCENQGYTLADEYKYCGVMTQKVEKTFNGKNSYAIIAFSEDENTSMYFVVLDNNEVVHTSEKSKNGTLNISYKTDTAKAMTIELRFDEGSDEQCGKIVLAYKSQDNTTNKISANKREDFYDNPRSLEEEMFKLKKDLYSIRLNDPMGYTPVSSQTVKASELPVIYEVDLHQDNKYVILVFTSEDTSAINLYNGVRIGDDYKVFYAYEGGKEYAISNFSTLEEKGLKNIRLKVENQNSSPDAEVVIMLAYKSKDNDTEKSYKNEAENFYSKEEPSTWKKLNGNF